jgi:hypothetical protein
MENKEIWVGVLVILVICLKIGDAPTVLISTVSSGVEFCGCPAAQFYRRQIQFGRGRSFPWGSSFCSVELASALDFQL